MKLRLLARPTIHAVCPSVCLARGITEYKQKLTSFYNFYTFQASLSSMTVMYYNYHHYYHHCSSSSVSSSSSSPSPQMALQSNSDLRLLTGLLPVSSVFWPLYSICNFAFINICTQFQNLFYFRPLSRLPWRLLLHTWLNSSRPIHCVNTTNQIQRPYSDEWKHI
jgi:hypothetical protein